MNVPKRGVAAKPKSFGNLSTDIQSLILSFVTRPRDLAAVCLVCRHLHQVAIRHLYREITLDIGGPKDDMLPAFVKLRNPGLKHIRVLDLYNAPEPCDGKQARASFVVNMILQFLPQDILEKFRWHPWDVFSAENLVLLYRNQRRLERLEAISLDKPFTPALQRRLDLDSVVTDRVKALGLYPVSQDALEFSHELLKRKKSLVKLTIDAHFLHSGLRGDDDDLDDDDDDDIAAAVAGDFAAELNDTPTRPGRLTSTLFRHMLPFDKCTPISVQDLTLEQVYLRYSADTYCRTLDMAHLKKLRVIECGASGAFFAALCRTPLLPHSLDVLEVTHSNDAAEGELMNALDEFVPLLSSLRELLLDIGGASRLPSAAAIARHGKTLRLLSVHTFEYRTRPTIFGSSHMTLAEEWSYDAAQFRTICRACRGLRQLSVAFPETAISAAPKASFLLFRSLVNRYLHDLVTLQLSRWPSNGGQSSSSSSASSSRELTPKLYGRLLQGIAQEFFEANRPEEPMPSFLKPGYGTRAGKSAADAEHNQASTGDEQQSSSGPSTSPPLPAQQQSQQQQAQPPTPRPGRRRQPRGSLRLIAFGTADCDYDRAEKSQMAIFGRATVPHPGEALRPSSSSHRHRPSSSSASSSHHRRRLPPRRVILALPLGRNERPWWEPEGDVLDWALQRGNCMPVTGLDEVFRLDGDGANYASDDSNSDDTGDDDDNNSDDDLHGDQGLYNGGGGGGADVHGHHHHHHHDGSEDELV